MAKTDLEKTLQQFGLDGKRAAVYLALLQTGRVPIPQVAKTAGVKRTTAYSILKSLEEEGLVSRGVLGKKQIFIPEDPAKIQTLLLVKQKSLERILPELRSFYNLIPSKPKVRFYEGLEGIKSIFEDVLITKPKELVVFTSLDDLINILGTFIKNYTARKADFGIPTRAISTDTPLARRYNQLHYAQAKPPAVPEIRFVPKEKFLFKTEINIYSNKIAIMSLKTEELVGVVMESVVVADTQRAIFELAWEATEKYQ